MSKYYETVFILTPVLSKNQVEETIENVNSLLKKNQVGIEKHESWGLKKLAYPIKKKKTGYYELFLFSLDGEIPSKNIISELELFFNRDERVIRFLIIRLNQHSFEYYKKNNNGIKQPRKTS